MASDTVSGTPPALASLSSSFGSFMRTVALSTHPGPNERGLLLLLANHSVKQHALMSKIAFQAGQHSAEALPQYTGAQRMRRLITRHIATGSCTQLQDLCKTLPTFCCLAALYSFVRSALSSVWPASQRQKGSESWPSKNASSSSV